MKQKSSLDAIREACRMVGGQAEMSRKLGVSSPTVNQWTTGIRQIPAERCPEIEKVTGGSVTCEELRPDVEWRYLRGTSLSQVRD
ncbi:helix-turn-helix domain-containing protein [Klebsiella grimontii]|uniref:transcriptional regulator n=1 Tax=Klebsiella TaxID=570 RepID=UPI0028DAEC72|nr:helix-turn-helix domain-containing protein [Klebsiella grimontii]MDT8624861.1 helix-turn-helix domain-containing protein [Klebsiella grimontii]